MRSLNRAVARLFDYREGIIENIAFKRNQSGIGIYNYTPPQVIPPATVLSPKI